MQLWDLFQHKEAARKLSRAVSEAVAITEAWEDSVKVQVLRTLEEQVKHLEILAQKISVDEISPELLGDLLANAQRRADQGRYDDAITRLYRSIELAMEIELYDKLKIRIRDPKTFPEDLKSFRGDFRESRGIRENLEVANDLLSRRGHQNTLTRTLLEAYQGQLGGLMERRNQSILAHGLNPVKQEDFVKFWEFLNQVGFTASPPWPRWPSKA
jgi:CRISPR-associated protein (TIGR02710 family)